jgi:predicted nuclease with TOPRIM domain
MYCHKQHELNSLRAKLHRFENGKEFKDLSDSLDKMKSRAEFLQQMSQANREKRIHAEEEAKEAKSACRKLEKENARLTKEIDWLRKTQQIISRVPLCMQKDRRTWNLPEECVIWKHRKMKSAVQL